MLDIIFWFSDGQLVFIGIILMYMLVELIGYSYRRVRGYRLMKTCKDGRHEQSLRTSNYHYDYYECECEEKWKMISKH